MPEVVETMRLRPTSDGRRAWTAASASHTRASVSMGMLSVRGRSRPGNVVTRRVVRWVGTPMAGRCWLDDSVAVVAIVAMVVLLVHVSRTARDRAVTELWWRYSKIREKCKLGASI